MSILRNACVVLSSLRVKGPFISSLNQVRDMTAFVIHYCIVTHIKITIQSLYCNPLPYCDHNTDSPLLFNYFF